MLERDLRYEDKVWGKTAEIMHNKEISIHHLKLMAGGRCSIHYHKQRSNEFYVTKGKVLIESWDERESVQKVLLLGERAIIPRGIKHRFSALTDGEMYEMYYPSHSGRCSRYDIVRVKEGYMASPEELDELLLLLTKSS